MVSRLSTVLRRVGVNCAGSGAGVLLDALLGELPLDPHPVAAFGTAMGVVEDRLWRDERAAGVRYTSVGLGIGVLAGTVVGSTTVATTISVAGRMLGDTALTIGAHLDRGDLQAARGALPSLVGRDPARLDEKEIARAVIESVAENTVDAVVAPALWSAAVGAPGVLAHRAVNTMDAMVGHHSDRYEHFGWASARLDDVLNWIPARATAGLVMLTRPSAAADVARIVTRDAKRHPSPNAGVAESAFAAALGIQVGGTNVYGDRVEQRAVLGDGPPPTATDIGCAVELSNDVARALAGILFSVGLVSTLHSHGRRRDR
jgi:adenosylcobinamide-phosphate synthase